MNREVIEEIRTAANIVDVVGSQVSLRKQGKNYVGLCPFHQEKTPSFSVSDERQLFHCFGCGASGSVFDFLMRTRNITFAEAAKDLARRYNVSLPKPRETERGRRVRELADQLFRANELAADYFQHTLLEGTSGAVAREYLHRRDISKEGISDFRLGYAPPNWHGLKQYLLGLKVSQQIAVQAGLLAQKSQREVYDRFRDRLMFPIRDMGGRVVGFGGRALDESLPKYLNSPETPIFQKRRTLYGLHTAREACRQSGEVLVVEGYFDLLALYSKSIGHVVAPLGTALTSHHLRLLARLAPRTVLVFDGDEAGQRAAMRSLELFLREKVPARILTLPEGMDPDDFLRQEGEKAFLRQIKEARPLIEVFLEQSLGQYDGSVSGRRKVLHTVTPMLKLIDSKIDQERFLRILSEHLSISEEVVREEVGWSIVARVERESPRIRHAETRVPTMEEVVLRILMHYPNWIPVLEESKVLDDFQGQNWTEVGRLLVKSYDPETGSLDLSGLLVEVKEEALRKLISLWSVEANPWPQQDARDRLQEYLQGIQAKKRRLEDELKRLKQEIKSAEHSDDESLLADLLAEFLAKKAALLAGEANGNANLSKGEIV